jgi:hypothetical protein
MGHADVKITLARRAVGYDLCFSIAAAHLTTGDDRAALLATLAPFLDVCGPPPAGHAQLPVCRTRDGVNAHELFLPSVDVRGS